MRRSALEPSDFLEAFRAQLVRLGGVGHRVRRVLLELLFGVAAAALFGRAPLGQARVQMLDLCHTKTLPRLFAKRDERNDARRTTPEGRTELSDGEAAPDDLDGALSLERERRLSLSLERRGRMSRKCDLGAARGVLLDVGELADDEFAVVFAFAEEVSELEVLRV